MLIFCIRHNLQHLIFHRICNATESACGRGFVSDFGLKIHLGLAGNERCRPPKEKFKPPDPTPLDFEQIGQRGKAYNRQDKLKVLKVLKWMQRNFPDESYKDVVQRVQDAIGKKLEFILQLCVSVKS